MTTDAPDTTTTTEPPPPVPPAPPANTERAEIPPTVGRVVNCFSNRWEGVRSGTIANILREAETGRIISIRVNVQLDGIEDADFLSDVRGRHHGNTFEVLNARVYPPTSFINVPSDQDYVFAVWMPFQVGQAVKASVDVESLRAHINLSVDKAMDPIFRTADLLRKEIDELTSKQNTLLNQFAEHLAQSTQPAFDPRLIPKMDAGAAAAATQNEQATAAAAEASAPPPNP